MNEKTLSTKENEMIKPFTVEVGDEGTTEGEVVLPVTPTNEVKREAPIPRTVIKDGKEFIQPFTTIDTPKLKLYLLLKYYEDTDGEGGEQKRDFEFFEGTTQELYDKIREELIESDDSSVRLKLDAMKSRVYVDAPDVQISRKVSFYIFMKNMKVTGRIVDDTSFDIEDYKYDEENDENGEKE